MLASSPIRRRSCWCNDAVASVQAARVPVGRAPLCCGGRVRAAGTNFRACCLPASSIWAMRCGPGAGWRRPSPLALVMRWSTAASTANNVNATNGQNLASDIAGIVANSAKVGSYLTPAEVTVVVNNGPATTITNGVPANSGTPANADSYYCPTGSPPTWSWGSAVWYGRYGVHRRWDVREVRHRHRQLQLHALLRQLCVREEWPDDGWRGGPDQVIRLLSPAPPHAQGGGSVGVRAARDAFAVAGARHT